MKISIKTRVSRSFGGNAVAFLFLFLLGVFTILPILYTVINAFKPINELFLYPPRFFVHRPTLENFRELLRVQNDSLVPFERYVLNSVFVSVTGTAIYVIIAAMAAYPLAKHRFHGRVFIYQIIVWAILFRPEVTGVPQYIIMSKIHMIDNIFSVIFPAIAGSFGVFLMRQFMLGIPDEILESARIDGSGELNNFWHIVMPTVKPAWLTLIIFTFQGMWNTTGVQFIYSENLKMLPTALQQIGTAGYARAGVASTVALILMIPPILIFLFSENSVIETMAYSGLKS